MQKTLELLRREGYFPEIVERRINRIILRDLWGFVDVFAVNAEGVQLGVQTTTMDHMEERLLKAREAMLARPYLFKTNIQFEIHGWHKVGNKWECVRWPV